MNGLQIGWILDFIDKPADGLEFRFWSGAGDITFTISGEDITYKGTNGVINVAPPDERANESTRMVAEMSAEDPNVRAQMRRDLGPLKIRLRWIYKNDDTSDWTLSSKQFIGRLSAPTIVGGVYRIAVESLIGDLDRGRIQIWSHDSHINKYPDDRAFEYMRTYKDGIDTKWPP